MSIETMTAPVDPRDAALADETVRLVRRWLREASAYPASASAMQLAGILRDPTGLDFTVGFVDGVIRPEDLGVAAANLRRIAPDAPRFLPWWMRSAIRVGGVVAPVLPGVVVPIARRVLRHMVGHLILDATDGTLTKSIAALRGEGIRLNLNLLGEAVLGEAEADRRLRGTERLLGRDDVDYVSIKVSSTVAPHAPWAFDHAVEDVVRRLTPLFRIAASAPTPKFINLDMEEYRDLDLTIAVFTALLEQPEFQDLEAGIVLQAYLPDALAAMDRLQEWAAARRARGGAAVKVRVVKGANLPMERVEATVHGWPLATWDAKQDSDTHYKRVLDYALHPDRIRNVRIGVAGHNLFDIAHAWLLAGRRGVQQGIDFEMLAGMAEGQAEAVRRDVGGLLLYTPVVSPREFDVAIAYLIRRLEEGASPDNFMSAVFDLDADAALFEREEARFHASLEALADDAAPTHRVPGRYVAVPKPRRGRFQNTPDTDPAVAENRVWADAVLAAVPGSVAGRDAIDAARLRGADDLEAVIVRATEGAAAWRHLGGSGRAEVLRRAGAELEAARAELLEVMASEGGKTLDQGDPEVSEAIDFAYYYADRAEELDGVDGAAFVPSRITVVTPPWNFPVAIPAGSTLAALAAGSTVIIKPATPTERSGAVMVEALWRAGVPRDALQLVQLDEQALGRALVSDPRVDRVILTGAYETAELFRSFRPDLPLLAETSGKNAIIVTPSADLDLAVKDVVASAFGHAGQKCSATSLVVLVGSVARSERFRRQLLDAASSITVGPAGDATTRMGPLVEPAQGKLLSGLTRLGAGEEWLLEPRPLDDGGALWSPGIRTGVRPESEFHLTEYFGPVLGVMTAPTLDAAIALVNRVDYGLTSGLHSLDPAEIERWLGSVEAGNLYVNRGTTGAIVQRQPFGGWKRSSVGAGAKAGGPNYLIGLGDWAPRPASATTAVTHPRVRALVDAALPLLDDDAADGLRRAVASDAEAWESRFGRADDVSALGVERNILRYLPARTVIRHEPGAPALDLLRVAAAAIRAGSAAHVVVGEDLDVRARGALRAAGLPVTTMTDAEWTAFLGRTPGTRIRVVGGSLADVSARSAGRPDLAVWAGPVTEAGRIELLPFLREQAVSITAHRFGTPTDLTQGLI